MTKVTCVFGSPEEQKMRILSPSSSPCSPSQLVPYNNLFRILFQLPLTWVWVLYIWTFKGKFMSECPAKVTHLMLARGTMLLNKSTRFCLSPLLSGRKRWDWQRLVSWRRTTTTKRKIIELTASIWVLIGRRLDRASAGHAEELINCHEIIYIIDLNGSDICVHLLLR